MQAGDAVGNDCLEMERALSAAGHEVRIFAPVWDRGLDVTHVNQIGAYLRDSSDILIYHYTIAWDVALRLFQELSCRRVIKYHNVTPPEFFAPYHYEYARLCRLGIQQLAEFIAAKPDLYLGDSAFNVEDLIGRGADRERCRVVPPFHKTDALLEREADLDMLASLTPDAFGEVTNLLMVGRIVPNKGYEHLIRSFALYAKAYNRHSRLILAGRQNAMLHLYYQRLRQLIRENDLEGRVLFTGHISDAALKSCYLAAHVFMIQSEHEGFCVPLIEAMAFGVPVVALARGAVAETGGDAALVWDDPDPALFAASAHRVVSDEELRHELGEAGRSWYAERFDNAKIETRLLEALGELL